MPQDIIYSEKAIANRPYRVSSAIPLHELIIDGYRQHCKFSDDYYVSIAQHLQKTGYPKKLYLNADLSKLDSYFMDALFSVDIYKHQDNIINWDGFNVFEWRKQFDYQKPTQVKGLKYYRSREAQPIRPGYSINSIYRKIFWSGIGRNTQERFTTPPNSCHPDAIHILSKGIKVSANYLEYQIQYSTQQDRQKFLHKKPYSSWTVDVKIHQDENYLDFCLRLYHAYAGILSLDEQVLKENQFIGYDLIWTPEKLKDHEHTCTND